MNSRWETGQGWRGAFSHDFERCVTIAMYVGGFEIPGISNPAFGGKSRMHPGGGLAIRNPEKDYFRFSYVDMLEKPEVSLWNFSFFMTRPRDLDVV